MIKEAKKADCAALRMWPDNSPDSLREEFERLIEDGDAVCFLRYAEANRIVCFQKAL